MISTPEYVQALQPYVPGKPIEELEREFGIKNSIKLASNENPLGPSPAAISTIKNSFSDLNRYPDGSGFYLKQALSGILGVSEDELILGNGSNQLLNIAVSTFMQDGDEAVMATPSFVVYLMAVQSIGGISIQIPLKNYTHDLSAMADAITPKTKIIFIANPNNPTGTINKNEEFRKMLEKIPDNVLVIADEAYYEYVSDPDYADSMKYLRSEKNILILRTFSKIYGLAGLRLGYGIAKKEIISEMDKLREPFNTNSIAQKAGLAALGDKKHVNRSKNANEGGKKFLCFHLDSLGIKYVPTEANFIYILVENSTFVYESLLRMGVIIRPMGPKAIRVTIGMPEENRRFIDSLRKIFE